MSDLLFSINATSTILSTASTLTVSEILVQDTASMWVFWPIFLWCVCLNTIYASSKWLQGCGPKNWQCLDQDKALVVMQSGASLAWHITFLEEWVHSSNVLIRSGLHILANTELCVRITVQDAAIFQSSCLGIIALSCFVLLQPLAMTNEWSVMCFVNMCELLHELCVNRTL